jgi:beta-glucosidase
MMQKVLFCIVIVCALSQLPKFPDDFVWGTATSSYQIEGAYATEDRGLSVWDTFSKLPNKTVNGDNGDVACDHYSRWKQDVAMMKEVGVKAYRFSISWSRIFPYGNGAVLNVKGVAFYDNVINELIANGITPYITLFHWDSPQWLQDSYGGFLNESIVADFGAYSQYCFQKFGDRVKNWITLNEPWCYSYLGHYTAEHAPGRCSDRSKCKEGNRETEPYIVAHNLILAHATAVQIYRTRYQATQNGTIGITLICDWKEPYSPSLDDAAAANRLMEFQCAWFYDPIYFGDYPASMRTSIGARLPTFTPEQKKMVQGSSDFFGLNHYSSRYVRNGLSPNEGYDRDSQTLEGILNINGTQIGPQAQPPWLYSVPWGFRKIVGWISSRYNKVPIYITENGVGEQDTGKVELDDQARIKYYSDYLTNLNAAIYTDGANVKGYFAWSFMDNFEWAWGYSQRFGLIYVDFNDGLKRYKKASALWFQRIWLQYNPQPVSPWIYVFVAVILGSLLVAIVGMLLVMISFFVIRKLRKSEYSDLRGEFDKM